MNPPNRPIPVTPRQLEVLRYFRARLRTDGFAPTIPELAKALGVARQTADGHVRSMIDKRLLERPFPRSHRGLALTEAAESYLDRTEAAAS